MAVGDRYIGANAVIMLKKATDTGALVNISGSLSGLSSIDFDVVRDIREIAGGGRNVGSQLLPWKDGSGSIACDDNATTFPLFWDGHAVRFNVEIAPEGTETGKPKFEFEAILDITINYEARGVITYAITMNIDGDVTESVYA